ARYTVSDLHAYDEFGKPAIVYEKSLMPSLFGSCNSVSLFIALPILDMGPTLPIHPGTTLLLLDQQGHVFGSFGGDFNGLNLASQINTDTITTYEHLDEAYVCTFVRSEVGPFTYAALTPKNLFWKQTNYIMTVTIIGFMVAAVVGLIMTILLLQHNYTPLRNTIQLLQDKRREQGSIDTRGKSEYDVIRDHFLDLYTRTDDMMNDFTRQQRHLVDRYLYDLFHNGSRHLADDDVLESLHIDFSGLLLVPIAVYITNPRDNLLTSKGNATISLSFAIENVLNDLQEHRHEPYKTEDEYTVTFLYALAEKDHAAFDQSVETVLGQLCNFFKDHFNLILRCVISEPVDHVGKLSAAYHDMNAAYVYQIASSEKNVLRVSQLSEKKIAGAMPVNDYAHLLVEAIAIRATADTLKIVDEFFLELGQAGDVFRVQRFNVFALTSTLLNMGYDQACGMNKAMIEELVSAQNLAELKEMFVRITVCMCQNENEIKQEASLSDKVKQYVNEQYADINLSLTQIAQEIKLSPKYVSKLFKIETGQGLLDYINAVRIQKAKERMVRHDEPIQKLAEAVGYSSTKTFRRAFRKIEGINPGQFRS
ncbi:MAG: helix-turn-helix transcriptional regulator, partial [Clostridiaceae bacterium]|nr:helix-turn-helix transcriptional regulator [Clostridiaceae bacterium]